MKLIFLGTAGAVARENRDNTSLLFQFRKNFFLIDTPGSLVQKLKKLHINYFKINHIFLTHIHPDHIYGLPAFIHARMFDNSSRIHIYAHRDTLKLVRKLLQELKLQGEKFPIIKFIPLKNNSSLQIFKGVDIQTFAVKHSPTSLGIKISALKKKIVFSSDTAYSKNLIQISQKADCLIHDCFSPERFFKKYPQLYKMHTSTKTLARIFQETKSKMLIPIHFSGELKFGIKEISKELQEEGVKNIYIPQDFQVKRIV